ncbi:MAG: hypothetical protein ACRDTC_19525 [Pseudonocardiaceae bacterium]
MTLTGVTARTPTYLAPEIARGKDTTFAAALFSLGSALYAAVEAALPFGLDDNRSCLRGHGCALR